MALTHFTETPPLTHTVQTSHKSSALLFPNPLFCLFRFVNGAFKKILLNTNKNKQKTNRKHKKISN